MNRKQSTRAVDLYGKFMQDPDLKALELAGRGHRTMAISPMHPLHV